MNSNASLHPTHTAIRGASAVVASIVGSRPASAGIVKNAAGGMTKPSNAAT